MEWWSIEVRDAVLPAQRWKDGYGELLLEAAITHGAKRWEWTVLSNGILLELGFHEADDWNRFRTLAVVTAALDATPDPVNGLFVYPGRGGSSTLPRRPRTPRPMGSGAAEIPAPVEPPVRAVLAEPSGEPAPMVRTAA